MKIVIALLVSLLAIGCDNSGACETAAVAGSPATCQEIKKSRCEAPSSVVQSKYLGGSCASYGYVKPCQGGASSCK